MLYGKLRDFLPTLQLLDVLKWKILLQVKPNELLSLPWQVTTGAFTTTRSFQAEPAGRALKGMSQATL